MSTTASLVILEVSPSAVPGQMTFEGWRIARTSHVFAADGSAWASALRCEGVPVDAVDATDARGAAAAVVHACAAATSVVWLDDGSTALSGTTDAVLSAATDARLEIDRVVGAVAPPGSAVTELVRVMDVLRSPGGCPWDAEQTHRSLVKYLLEEAYEVVDAVDAADDEHLREELGDLLLQIAFHSRIAQERDGGFDIDDVARGITAKMVRRHPHVFADGEASTPAEVAATWEELKRAEKGRTSVFDGIAASQPALPLAQTYVRRATARDLPPPVDGDPSDVGDQLLALIAAAQLRGIDAEAALRASARRYAAQIRAIELRDTEQRTTEQGAAGPSDE